MKQDAWNQRYAVDEYIFGTEPSDILSKNSDLFQPGQRALAIADGEGRNGVYLASLGLQVTSFDISEVAIQKAKKLATREKVILTILESDIESWRWEEAAFDAVVGVFFQFLDPLSRANVFAGMIATLKPGGLVFLRGYTPKQLDYKTGGPSTVENLYTPDLLTSAFQGFEILQLDEHEVNLNEGPRHTGMSAFVDFIARKP
ncbi:MAG TPA: methyltransferase domain-containing protein [Acidocella sp.]|nr:MAG: SAM-dependent methyltransferase [Acidocella sp. 20-58-15]HQT39154.1 methyltransferase domain-containing protein [Acidocella sp.]